MKKTKDKKLKEEIEILLEKFEEETLENIVENAPDVTVEKVEVDLKDYKKGEIVRVLPEAVSKGEQTYVKVADYSKQGGVEGIKEDLRTSGLMTRTGFHGTSESRRVVEEKMGEYSEGKQNVDKEADYAIIPQLERLEKEGHGLTERSHKKDYGR